MRAVTVRREAGELGAEAAVTVGDDEDDQRAEEAADDLAAEVEGNVLRLGLADGPQTDGHRRVDVTPGDRTDRIRRAEQRETEREGDPEHSDGTAGQELPGREDRGAG